MIIIIIIHLAYAEWDDSLPFSGISSIPLCYIPFPSTPFHQLVFHPLSRHHAIYNNNNNNNNNNNSIQFWATDVVGTFIHSVFIQYSVWPQVQSLFQNDSST